ncbi:hypothetical protein [Phenylobacterium sp.]|jgi:hypothetical protein|uniref:hypothetical protein n=1 Tax=Phenylobacterium sp. TaxID=1871053 RepID=UPI002F91DBC4
MQTFRAYIQNAAGAVTWAAWIEADHRQDAESQASALCPGQTPMLDLWSATERKLADSCRLDPV